MLCEQVRHGGPDGVGQLQPRRKDRASSGCPSLLALKNGFFCNYFLISPQLFWVHINRHIHEEGADT